MDYEGLRVSLQKSIGMEVFTYILMGICILLIGYATAWSVWEGLKAVNRWFNKWFDGWALKDDPMWRTAENNSYHNGTKVRRIHKDIPKKEFSKSELRMVAIMYSMYASQVGHDKAVFDEWYKTLAPDWRTELANAERERNERSRRHETVS